MSVADIWLQVLLKLAARCRVAACTAHAPQSDYNAAFKSADFTLDDRTADLMLNVTLALMFATGMPLLYPILFFALLLQQLAERHAVANVCSTPVRYNTSLPYLVVRLLPLAVAAHLALGLWMNTYFETSSRVLKALLTDGWADTAARIPFWARITQPNGVVPLALLLLIVLYLVALRFVLGPWICRPLAANCRCALRCLCGCCAGRPPEPEPISYEEALVQGRLVGVPTYRLPNHPSYARAFATSIYKPIWVRALGTRCFTRLAVSTASTGVTNITVLQDVMYETRRYTLEEAVAGMPDYLQEVALRLANPTFSGAAGGYKRCATSDDDVAQGASRMLSSCHGSASVGGGGGGGICTEIVPAAATAHWQRELSTTASSGERVQSSTVAPLAQQMVSTVPASAVAPDAVVVAVDGRPFTNYSYFPVVVPPVTAPLQQQQQHYPPPQYHSMGMVPHDVSPSPAEPLPPGAGAWSCALPRPQSPVMEAPPPPSPLLHHRTYDSAITAAAHEPRVAMMGPLATGLHAVKRTMYPSPPRSRPDPGGSTLAAGAMSPLHQYRPALAAPVPRGQVVRQIVEKMEPAAAAAAARVLGGPGLHHRFSDGGTAAVPHGMLSSGPRMRDTR